MSDEPMYWVGPSDAPTTYQLTSRIGGGAAGEVWRGFLALPDGGRRTVAIKISRGSGHPDEAAWWTRYGHALISLTHTALAPVSDAFLANAPSRGGQASAPGVYRYVVMDFIDGLSSAAWIADHPAVTAARRVALLRPIAGALDEMHSGARAGFSIGHGDVKPANIITGVSGAAVLVDLGRVEYTGDPQHRSAYLAPEVRVPRAQPTPGADAYAFAVTLAQLLTGLAPPTDPSGFLDVAALERQLQSSAHTDEWSALVQELTAVLNARTDARPELLQPWLDTIAESLAQSNRPGRAASAAGAAGDVDTQEATPLSLTPHGPTTPEPVTPELATPEPALAVSPESVAAEPEPSIRVPTDVPGQVNVPVAPPPSQYRQMTHPGPASMQHDIAAGDDPQQRPVTWRNDKRLWIVAAAVVALLAAAGTIFALTAGGTKHGSHLAGPSATRPVSASPTPPTDTAPPGDTGAPSTGQSGTPTTPQSDNPGDTVLSQDALAAACSQSSAPTDANTDGSGGPGVGSDWSGKVDEILPDGTVIADCADSNSEASGVAAITARTDTVLWTRDLPGTQNPTSDGNGDSQVLLSGGGKYLYLLQVTDHPAEGLHDEYFTRTVSAIDAKTGMDGWTKTLEKSDRTDNNANGSVDEQLTTRPGQTVAIVHVDDYSAFDADTGNPIWERHDLSSNNSNAPFLAGYDRSLDVTTNDNGNEVVIGTDLATGKQWSTLVGTNTGTAESNDDAELVGTDYWFFNAYGYDAYNLLSGKHTAHGVFPSSFSNVLATPRYTVAQVGATLRLYKTGRWSTPLWSQTSDGVTPYIVTSKVVLVQAAAGYELLNVADGRSLQNDVSFNANQSNLVDGLLITDNGVIDLGKP